MNNVNDQTKQTVYISFNNNDSSVSSFISYLDTALCREGIDVVLYKTGHELGTAWSSHIKLTLVVFSNADAVSVACLERLVKLLEFLQKEGHVVVPVFYNAIVKQQMEIFGDMFAELEKSYSVDQVTKWQRALGKTMELQGHEYSDELREESKFIEKIAKDVFEKLYPTEHIGIHRVLLEIRTLLLKQSWGYRSIAILGKPGIGKTTLAKAAFRKMRDAYDASRFIIECNNKIFELLSDEDLQETPMKKFDLNNPDTEPCHRRKRVLIVLDDVQNAQDVEAFLGGFDRFGPGSLLIITSSDRKVLEQCHLNETYELKGLNDEDALKLFARCLCGKDVIEEKLLKASMRAIKRCDGNPSALRSYAEKATVNSFSTTLKQSFFFTATHNYEKLPRLDLPNRFFEFTFIDLRAPYLYHDSMQVPFFCDTSHSFLCGLNDLLRLNFPCRALESLPNDLRILHLGQEYVLVCQLNKPWEGHKTFSTFKIIKHRHSKKLVEVEEIPEARDTNELIDLQDCTSMKNSIPVVTDQLEPLQVINLSGCIESQILQWRLQTDPLCILCNSANETRSHLYFDCTFCWSIWTAISNRIHLSPLQIWEDVVSAMVNLKESKAKKILSQMAWTSTIYGLLVERNRRLYKQSYRSADAILAQIDRNFRIIASRLRKRRPKIASKILRLWLETSSSH